MSDATGDAPAGSPAWMATFADLMSLLMCFFVLLLSFSEMDAQKYKLVAGSMKNAFGVQREVVDTESPSGAAEIIEDTEQAPTDPSDFNRQAMIERIAELVAETDQDVESITENMTDEISEGLVEVESGFRNITIRIKEKGSFGSGSADLQDAFVPVMEKLRDVLAGVDGDISVEGHTDNIAISTEQFPSNWALSSARALSVGHELLKDDVLDETRFVIVGHAETSPYVENDSAEGRAKNRRVEILIKQPVSAEIDAGIRTLEEEAPELVEGLEIDE